MWGFFLEIQSLLFIFICLLRVVGFFPHHTHFQMASGTSVLARCIVSVIFSFFNYCFFFLYHSNEFTRMHHFFEEVFAAGNSNSCIIRFSLQQKQQFMTKVNLQLTLSIVPRRILPQHDGIFREENPKVCKFSILGGKLKTTADL